MYKESLPGSSKQSPNTLHAFVGNQQNKHPAPENSELDPEHVMGVAVVSQDGLVPVQLPNIIIICQPIGW